VELDVDNYSRDVASLDHTIVNPTADPVLVPLGSRLYFDLDQNPVFGTLTLAPFTSRVVVDNGLAEVTFADGFESGTTSAWSAVTP